MVVTPLRAERVLLFDDALVLLQVRRVIVRWGSGIRRETEQATDLEMGCWERGGQEGRVVAERPRLAGQAED